ncbi:hypothetical protein VIRA109638_15595 [Vibrio rarus]
MTHMKLKVNKNKILFLFNYTGEDTINRFYSDLICVMLLCANSNKVETYV